MPAKILDVPRPPSAGVRGLALIVPVVPALPRDRRVRKGAQGTVRLDPGSRGRRAFWELVCAWVNMQGVTNR